MPSNEAEQNVVIECRNLSKIYRSLWTRRSQDVHALKEMSLTVERGQIVGLIGPNGAGKSTLLNLIAGLIHPSEGHISMCGHGCRSLEARRCLGYMPESPVFLGRYSACEVLRLHGSLYGFDRQRARRESERLLDELELKEAADRPCEGFSQGMRQRLALGVALMNKPRALLLDEPSNGLDPIGIIRLREILQQLSDSGTAILISSHRLGELDKLTKDYVFLHRGQIVPFNNGIISEKTGLLRIGLISGQASVEPETLADHTVMEVSDSELVLEVEGEEETADIINELVRLGVRIKSVSLQKEDIEDVFIRLHNERT